MPAPCPFCGHVGHVEDRTISDLGMHSVHRCARCDREFTSAPELPERIFPLWEETARLKQASLKMEKLLYGLVHTLNFEALNISREELEDAIVAGAIARRRVTLAEQEAV